MILNIFTDISTYIQNFTDLIDNFKRIINVVFGMIPQPFGTILSWAAIVIIAIIIIHIVRG